MKTHTFYIGMGSNAPDAEAKLAVARQLMADRMGPRLWFSTPVKTKPIDFPNPTLFTNQVAFCVAAKGIKTLQQILKEIEQSIGRLPRHKHEGLVVIDLDLLSVDDCVCRSSDWERPYIHDGVVELQQLCGALPSYSDDGVGVGSGVGSGLGSGSSDSSSLATSSTPTNSSR